MEVKMMLTRSGAVARISPREVPTGVANENSIRNLRRVRKSSNDF
jgi:hypothetical protein